MNWEPRPLPSVTPETAPYWDATADGRLLLCHCTDCDLTYYYPRALCPDCTSDAVEWQEATGRGVVYSYAPTELVSDWPEDALPVVVAYVELDEGPRVLTNLVDCDPADVEVGAPVDVTFVDTDEDLSIPVFELRE
jgi:uncharacterized OB-fold protein